ncbi:MAG: peptidase U32 family protein [Patescibacteria group bacterium]|nr:U32 family peptidase [Patescibacteria group bacterium]
MTQKKNNKIEILAPAGSFETLRTAIDAGCDSVYLGVGDMNMRAGAAKNFQVSDLAEVAKLCHEKGVRAYITINNQYFDEELDRVKALVDEVAKHELDAVIAADMSIVIYAQGKGPEVHISTQLSVSNIESLKFYAQYADRFVLARELSLKQVKYIADQIKKQKITGPKGQLVQIEVFGHGALCVAVSGRCAMSLYCYNKSANRGLCTQICRRAYKVTDIETSQELKIDNNYVMSAADLCTIGMLDRLIDSGVNVLKIEGRARTPDYVDTVVHTYRDALEAVYAGTYTKEKVKEWNERLKTVFNRGFTEGFYMGRKADEWSRGPGNKAVKKRFQLGVVTNYFNDLSVAEVALHADAGLEEGDEFNITGQTTGLVQGKITGLRADGKPARNAGQGDVITFKVPRKVRRGDVFFVIRKNIGQGA